MSPKDLFDLLPLVQNLSRRHREQLNIVSKEEGLEAGWFLALQEEELKKAVSALSVFCASEGLTNVRCFSAKDPADYREVLLKRIKDLKTLEVSIYQEMLSSCSDEEVWSVWLAKH